MNTRVFTNPEPLTVKGVLVEDYDDSDPYSAPVKDIEVPPNSLLILSYKEWQRSFWIVLLANQFKYSGWQAISLRATLTDRDFMSLNRVEGDFGASEWR